MERQCVSGSYASPSAYSIGENDKAASERFVREMLCLPIFRFTAKGGAGPSFIRPDTSLIGVFMCFLGCTSLCCLTFRLDVCFRHDTGKLEAMERINKVVQSNSVSPH
jgi:hypothetical protein